MAPPPNRPDHFGPGGPEQDPALRLPALRLQLAQQRAQYPSDDEFEALLSAQQDAQRAQRVAQQQQITRLEDVVAELESGASQSS